MRWLIVFSTVVVSIAVLPFVPVTADFALLINEFNHLKKILPDNLFVSELPEGFLCSFGKLTLNLAAAFEVFESEDIEKLQNAIEISVVTTILNGLRRTCPRSLRTAS